MRSRLTRLASLAFAVACGPAAASAQPVVFTVDPSTSHVRIHLGRSGLLKFMGHEHHIEAPLTEGRVEVAHDDPARSTVALRFAAAALYVIPGTEPAEDIPEVEKRMRAEVLEVERHPEVVFASTAVKGGDSGARLKLVVAGTLTLKGRSFPVEVPLEAEKKGEALEASGEVELNLRDFGIEPPSVAGVVKVSNKFKLEFDIRARAQPAAPPPAP
jgi:polyisoprenoid-binding protein YceI